MAGDVAVLPPSADRCFLICVAYLEVTGVSFRRSTRSLPYGRGHVWARREARPRTPNLFTSARLRSNRLSCPDSQWRWDSGGLRHLIGRELMPAEAADAGSRQDGLGAIRANLGRPPVHVSNWCRRRFTSAVGDGQLSHFRAKGRGLLARSRVNRFVAEHPAITRSAERAAREATWDAARILIMNTSPIIIGELQDKQLLAAPLNDARWNPKWWTPSWPRPSSVLRVPSHPSSSSLISGPCLNQSTLPGLLRLAEPR